MIELPEEFSDLSPRRQRQIASFLEKEIAKAQLDFFDQAVKMMLSIPVLVLKDKFGFGKERHHRFLQGCSTWLKAIHDDPNTMVEIFDAAQQEAGFTLELF